MPNRTSNPSHPSENGYGGLILGVTGNVLEEDVEFFIQHGANEVLGKPVSLERIKAYWDKVRRQASRDTTKATKVALT